MPGIKHLEDYLFENREGIDTLTRYIDDLYDIFQGKKSDTQLTIKWDGSPSIFFGEDIDNKFFVATKSISNVFPKINYTNEDIDRNHPNPESLNKVLKIALEYLPKLNPNKIVQADVLFVENEFGLYNNLLTFNPNTITYGISSDNTLFDIVNEAKIGLVYHTTYTHYNGNLIGKNFDTSDLKMELIPEVWHRDASITIPNNLIENEDHEMFSNILLEIDYFQFSAPKAFVNRININRKLNAYISEYINATIKQDGVPNESCFLEHVFTELTDSIVDAKKEETKQNRIAVRNELAGYIIDNINHFKKIFELWNDIHKFKVQILEKLSGIDTGIKCFIKEEGTMKPSKHEGYILNNNNLPIKLVDRFEFSKANFNNTKWS